LPLEQGYVMAQTLSNPFTDKVMKSVITWSGVTTGCPIEVLTFRARPFTEVPKRYQYLRMETNSAGGVIEHSTPFLIACALVTKVIRIFIYATL
jgi:hypothetical protein